MSAPASPLAPTVPGLPGSPPWLAAIDAGLKDHQIAARDFMVDNAFCGVFLTMGGGKAQPLDSLVLTPQGFVPMREIKVGSTVITPSGEHASVSGVFPQGVRPVYRLVLSDGRDVLADEDHLWSVTDASDRHLSRSVRHMTTKQLRENLTYRNGDSKWFIETVSPASLGQWSSSLDPYLLGVLLGDGHFGQHGVSLSNPDEPILDAVRSLLPVQVTLKPNSGINPDGLNWRLASPAGQPNPVLDEIRRLGLCATNSENKFVPQQLLHSGKRARLRLLQGLLDTDGTPHRSGFDFTVKSKQLAHDLLWLAHSLGASARIRPRILRTGPYAGNEYYRVSGRLPYALQPFTLPRKAEALSQVRGGRERVHLAIRSIEQVDDRPTQCILVDHPDHEYVTDGFIRTHNTRATLSALSHIRAPGHVLVVAPRNIAVNTWPQEIADRAMPVRCVSLNVTGPDALTKRGKPLKQRNLTPAERKALIDAVRDGSAPPAVYTVSNDTFHELVRYIATDGDRVKTPNYSRWPFPVVVIDESQSFKSHQSKTRFKSMVKVRPYLQRLIELSGTPAPEEIGDIWTQVYLLDLGQALGKTYGDFRERWFKPHKIINGQVTSWKPRTPEAIDEIHAAIEHLALSRENTELSLPPRQDLLHTVSMSPELIEAYQDFKAQSVIDVVTRTVTERLALEEGARAERGEPPMTEDERTAFRAVRNDDVLSIVAENRGVLHGKLLQFAAGSVYLNLAKGDPGYERATAVTRAPSMGVHSLKLDRLVELLDRHDAVDGSPVMIAYRFNSDLDRLLLRLHETGRQAKSFDGRRDTLAAWNAGQVPVLLLHPASAGHGLNFQHGGHTLIWYNLPDSNEHFQQTNARLHRMGQTRPVTIHTIVTAGTIDERQPTRLAHKGAQQQRLLDALNKELFGTLSPGAQAQDSLLDLIDELNAARSVL